MKRILFLLTLGLVACDNTDVDKELVIPAKYDGASYETNASLEIQMTDALASLSAEMKKGRTGTKVDASEIEKYFSVLRASSSDYFAGLIDSDWMPALIENSGGQLFDAGKQGGLYGEYLFTQYGIENEQVIEKGLYAASFYNQARKIAETEKTAAASDKIIALWGAHPDFANSNNSSLHSNPDKFIANYIARRDKNDGLGFYTNIQNGLIKLQAANSASTDYPAERAEAIQEIFENWEKGSAATAINYIYGALGKLSSTNPDEATISSAMHSFSEVLGFILGFRTVEDKIISDAEIDEILVLLNTPEGQTPTTLNLLSNPVEELPKVLQVITKLKAIYGFSDQEMEDFKQNWVSEQNR